MNTNKVIHEAMGRKLPDCDKARHKMQHPFGFCVTCGAKWPHLNGPAYPDYTSPTHYCALMDWMRDIERIMDLEKWACQGDAGVMYIDFENWMHSTRQEQVNLVAEAISEGVLK